MPLTELTDKWLARLGWPATMHAVMLRVLTACDSLGQLVRGSGSDFIAYVRLDPSQIEMIRVEDVDGVLGLPTETLQGGSLLYVIAAMADAPGWAARTIFRLRRLPGVESMAAERLRWKHRWDDRLRVKKVSTPCRG